MQAIVMREFGDESVLVLEEVAELEPGPGQVKVKLSAAGVNPAEAYIRQGGYAFFEPELPYVPGFDGAGQVVAVGSELDQSWLGKRVAVTTILSQAWTGTYAQELLCRPEALIVLPDSVSYAQGAALGIPGLAAYQSLFQRGKLQAGETVFIHGGSGGVGLLAIQMAKTVGAEVIATSSTVAGRQAILGAGADYAINHVKSGQTSEFISLANERADLVLEMLANENLNTDLELLANYGRIVIIGNRGSIDFNPRAVMAKEANIYGMAIWNMTEEDRQAAMSGLEGLLALGQVQPLVAETYPLKDASSAQKSVIQGGHIGKIVLEID